MLAEGASPGAGGPPRATSERASATIVGMATRRDPLAGVELLVIDGSNLLHALRGRSAEVGPAAAIVGRLRGVIPAETTIQLVFDGPPDRGLGTARIAAGLGVRYSGRRSADDVIVQLARDVLAVGAAGVLVVTDDRELGIRLRRSDARVIGTAWLIGRLGRARLSSPSPGRATPPAAAPGDLGGDGASKDEEASARLSWQPGRGATAKRGNPRRSPRRRSRTEPGTRG
jgi:hypothetical protein